MQSMFRIPWSHDTPGDKIMEKANIHKPRPMPVVDLLKLKRKRTDSPEPAPAAHHAHIVKKWKSAHGEVKPAVTESGSADRMSVVDGVVPAATQIQSQRQPQLPKECPGPVVNPAGESSPGRPDAVARSNPDVPEKEAAAQPKPPNAPHSVATTTAAPLNNTKADNAPAPAMQADDLNRAQQTIEAQFNFEILLKHNELRLIEQELAKCQVALEQLRRCQLVPFPGSQGPSENVSGGVGPALQPPRGYTEPQFAAPWGVTDGPYTRHYAKWLIPDPKFDSIPERALAAQSQGYFGLGEGRMTRGSFAEYPSSKARTSRTSTGALKHQALGENPAPAPKIDPLLHKRSTDGQWVRLYCAQCGHSNFSNTQGFLNHCRIKHNQVFKSHDAAAIACGVPVDVNEVGNPIPASEPPSASIPTTPAVTFPAPATPGFIQPLVRTNPTELAKEVHRDYSVKASRDNQTPVAASTAFQSSPSTPNLTALLKKRGFDGNLKEMVDTARTRVDLDNMDVSDDEHADSALQTPSIVHSKATSSPQLARHPVGAPNASPPSKKPTGRSGSKKGHTSGHNRLAPTALPPPVQVSSTPRMVGNVPVPVSPVDLSPHTVESNPGLMSDHDDDDDDEDGDDAHSEPRLGHADTGFVISDDVLVQDASDVEGSERRPGSRKGFGSFSKAEASKKK